MHAMDARSKRASRHWVIVAAALVACRPGLEVNAAAPSSSQRSPSSQRVVPETDAIGHLTTTNSAGRMGAYYVPPVIAIEPCPFSSRSTARAATAPAWCSFCGRPRGPDRSSSLRPIRVSPRTDKQAGRSRANPTTSQRTRITFADASKKSKRCKTCASTRAAPSWPVILAEEARRPTRQAPTPRTPLSPCSMEAPFRADSVRPGRAARAASPRASATRPARSRTASRGAARQRSRRSPGGG
jgi:hypothetical protein